MPESQEAQARDPYKTLELHPRAPRDLVAAAYWALIVRAKQRRGASSAAQIDELNAAYRLLADDAAREAYDEQQGVAAVRRPAIRVAAKGIRVFGIGAPVRMVSDHDDFYHLLLIDRSAGADVIDAAFAVLSGQAAGRDAESVFLRGLLEEARHTLRNAQRRAQYDASLHSGGRRQAPPKAVESRPSPAVPPAAHSLPPPSYPSRPMPRYDEVAAPDDGPYALPGTLATAGDGEDAEPAAAVAALEPAAVEEPQRDAPVVPPMFSKGGEASSPETVARTTYNLPPATSAARGILHRLRMPSRAQRAAETGHRTAYSRQELIIEAEHARLMTLREEGVGSAPAAAVQVGEAPQTAVILAELVFLEGPRAGERVPLGPEALNLGSGYASQVVLPGDDEHIAPEHARIWLHGDHFVFRQIDGGDSTICGEPLTLPMVMLDDGDDIRIGVHRMRLEHTAPG